LKGLKSVSMRVIHQDLRSIVLTVYLYCTVLAPAIIIWRRFGPRSSSEDWDVLKRGPQGHVAIVIRESTHRGVELPHHGRARYCATLLSTGVKEV
jgi:hypothetical protein